ncbi:MAG: hypothetical protein QXG00_06410 [Candidatus Woesearchaeota archaeon]
MKSKCQICNRKIEGTTCIWALGLCGYENLNVCPDCDWSLYYQILDILEEDK